MISDAPGIEKKELRVEKRPTKNSEKKIIYRRNQCK
jgi:hypothetical protein